MCELVCAQAYEVAGEVSGTVVLLLAGQEAAELVFRV